MRSGDWISERILFGFIIFFGYFLTVGSGALIAKSHPDSLPVIRDAMLTIGPLLGVIVTSIWKSDKADKANAEAAVTLANKQPDLSTSTVTVAPAVVVDSQTGPQFKG